MEGHEAALTQLLQRVAQGERGALDQVFAVLYPELRKIARARLRSQGGVAHLDTAALVLTDRKHFFTYAAKTMRNIIIDFAREQLAERRGGGQAALLLDTVLANEVAANAGEAALMRINDALLALESVDPVLAQVVEMRYFAGYSEVEVAELLGSPERTVRRQWEKARAFLLATLQE